MHANIDLIMTLTGGFGAALVFGFISQQLKLSPIAGYLVAGVVVGPFTPGFVARADLAEQLAEVGVVLLMFGVGLHFHLRELLAVRKVAIPGALVQIAVATALGIGVARWFGWSFGAGAVFGMAISVASTVVLLRVLADNGVLHTRTGHVAVGWLLVEDLFTVLALVLLPALATDGASTAPHDLLVATGTALLKVTALVALTLTVGSRVLPTVLRYVAKTRSRELFTLTVLVTALGVSVGAATVFGVSMALGAFLAGMVVGQSPFSSRAASEALPMRDAFAVLFFVSIGMLFDPSQLAEHAALTAATLAVILIGKPLAAFVVVRLLRYPIETAIAVSVALAQVGEFSFILAAVGHQLEILPAAARQSLVVAAIVSITLNPILFRWVRPLEQRLLARRAQQGLPAVELPSEPLEGDAHMVVIGYGPIGRTVTKILIEHDLTPTVIELNYETIAELKRAGIPAVYGDASQPTILEQAGIRKATSLIYAGADPSAQAVIQAARELCPQLQILTRTQYVKEVAAARAAGAGIVVAAEAEVAIAMTEHLLAQLGASSAQLDRSRDRVREELVGSTPSTS